MPILTVALNPQGPIVPVAVGVSGSRAQALRSAGQGIPDIVATQGLIDTGASCSGVDPTIIEQLELFPTGTASIHTPSTGARLHECNQYDVAFAIGMDAQEIHVVSLVLPVIEVSVLRQGFGVLLGRDVLARGLFVYDGRRQTLSLAF